MARATTVGVLLLLLGALASAQGNDYLTLEWSHDIRDSNQHVYVLNLDEDPSLEIIADTTRAGLVFGIDRVGEQIWKTNIPGVLFDMHARESPDNLNEIIVGTTPRAYSIAGNGSINWRYFTEHEKVGRVHLDDLDGDGRNEAVLTVLGGFRGNKILVVDENGERTLKIGFRSGDYPNALRAADLDGDGVKEIVVGFAVYSVNTISESMQLGYIRDASVRAFNMDGERLWSHSTAGGVKSIETADLDGDGVKEIIAGSNGLVYALNKDGGVLWTYPTNTLINDIKIRDVDSDGTPEVIAAGARVHVIAANGSKIWKTGKLGEIKSVDAADFDDDRRMEVVAAAGGVHLYDPDGEKLWDSEGVKYAASVVAADLNQDGFIEVVAGSGDSRVRLFSSKPYVGKRKAERTLNDATLLYEAGDLDVAEEKAGKAKLLFEGLVSAEGIKQTTELLDNIGKRREAGEMLSMAREKYENNSLDEARYYANQSKVLYTILGAASAAGEAENLLYILQITPKAEANLTLAREFYDAGDYLAAHEHAVNAEKTFQWIPDEDGVRQANQIIEDTIPYLTASSHLDNASEYFDDKMYVLALEEIKAAKEIYAGLGYAEGLARAEVLEKEVRKNRLKDSRIFWIEVALLVPMTFLTIALASAVYVIRRRKRRVHTETHLQHAGERAGEEGLLNHITHIHNEGSHHGEKNHR